MRAPDPPRRSRRPFWLTVAPVLVCLVLAIVTVDARRWSGAG